MRKAKERKARSLRSKQRKQRERAARDSVLKEFYGRNVGVSALLEEVSPESPMTEVWV